MNRPLSHEYRFVARTAPELLDQIAGLARRESMKGLKFRGRKLGVESVVNAMMLYLAGLDEAAQSRLLAEYVPRFGAMMGDLAGEAESSTSPGRDPGTGEPLPKPGRSKRTG